MGNTIGKEKSNSRDSYQCLVQLIDGGFLDSQGVYSNGPTYKKSIVKNLILSRRLMPFYKGLDNIESRWSNEELSMAVAKALGPQKAMLLNSTQRRGSGNSIANAKSLREHSARIHEGRSRVRSNSAHHSSSNLSGRGKDALSTVYTNAVECPICFLFYPPNFNYTRCCGQPICSECFVEIKRADPHLPTVHVNEAPPRETDLISEPACCPYCMTERFGIVYKPSAALMAFCYGVYDFSVRDTAVSFKSFNELKSRFDKMPWPPRHDTVFQPNDDCVVTTDFIRPDWQYKLERARRRAIRRAANAELLNQHLLELPGRRNSRDSVHGNSSRPSVSSRRSYLQSMEQRMIDEVIRLSLLDANPAQQEHTADSQNNSTQNLPTTVQRDATIHSTAPSDASRSARQARVSSFIQETMTSTLPSAQQSVQNPEQNPSTILPNVSEPQTPVSSDASMVSSFTQEEQDAIEELLRSPAASTNPFLSDRFVSSADTHSSYAQSNTIEQNKHDVPISSVTEYPMPIGEISQTR
ncbi:zf-C3HC4 type zinc finger [Schizosaccharomyces japonicus yFS275]|uniref:Zf-C3HC4 type zinc finger n=1 Tax=Schizosaccharomyces japonicus (strain yFS275 / FY16936) TaxID=402676 RepID=B6K0P5_SCHJY|nr:zf-C3HC4 type zinc finger [Schizosaccharomyces japonicus yFS275]EEB07516.1 zf-C3HC4 type zinc finger [Schizosaccharomyces japonicus yFS275]